MIHAEVLEHPRLAAIGGLMGAAWFSLSSWAMPWLLPRLTLSARQRKPENMKVAVLIFRSVGAIFVVLCAGVMLLGLWNM